MAAPKSPSHPRDVERVLDSIRVEDQQPKIPTERQTLIDSVAQEPEDPTPPGESRSMQTFLTALSWIAFILAITAVVYLTWSSGSGFAK